MDGLLDIVSWLLLTTGGVFVFIGGVGALRMPNLYTRMHAASVTDSIGPILIIAGIMLQAGISLPSVKLAAILLFLLLTGPTASNALASAALLAGPGRRQRRRLQHLQHHIDPRHHRIDQAAAPQGATDTARCHGHGREHSARTGAAARQ